MRSWTRNLCPKPAAVKDTRNLRSNWQRDDTPPPSSERRWRSRHREVIQPSASSETVVVSATPAAAASRWPWARPKPVSEINLHNRRCQGVVRRSFHGTSARLARVSTADQQPHLQVNALTAAACDRVFTETASGACTDRPTQEQLLDQEQPCPAGSFDSPPPPDWSPRPLRRSSLVKGQDADTGPLRK
jgi:hypothetical protein